MNNRAKRLVSLILCGILTLGQTAPGSLLITAAEPEYLFDVYEIYDEDIVFDEVDVFNEDEIFDENEVLSEEEIPDGEPAPEEDSAFKEESLFGEESADEVVEEGFFEETALAGSGPVVASGSYMNIYSWSLTSDGFLKISGSGSISFSSLANGTAFYNLEDHTQTLSSQVRTVCFDGLSDTEPLTEIYDGLFFPNADRLILGDHVHGSYEGNNVYTNGSSGQDIYVSVEIRGQVSRFRYENRPLLRQVRVSGSVGSLRISDKSALEDVVIASFTGSAIDTLAFRNAGKLRQFVIEELAGGSLSIKNEAFTNCSELEILDVPVGIISIGDKAFENCTALVSIPDMRQTAALGMYAFHGCASLSSAIYMDAQDVTIGEMAFAGCTSLPSVYIRSLADSNAHGWFYQCESLRQVQIDDCAHLALNGYTFCGCSSLEGVILPAPEQIGYGEFLNCASLEELPDLGNVTSYSTNQSRIPSASPRSPFAGCSTLKQIILPDALTFNAEKWYYDYSVGAEEMKVGFFEGCSNVELIHLPGSIGTSIPTHMFKDCDSLEQIDNLAEKEDLTEVHYEAFAGCTSLKQLTLPETISSIASLPDGLETFRLPGALGGLNTSLKLDHLKTLVFQRPSQGLYYVACEGWPSLETLYFEDTDDEQALADREINFSGLPSEQDVSIRLPDGVTSIKGIIGDCFRKIEIPEGVQSVGTISGANIREIVFPDSVTQLGSISAASVETLTLPCQIRTLGSYAFKNCSSLQQIIWPDALTSIGSTCFNNCPMLLDVSLPGTLTDFFRAFNKSSVQTVNLGEGITSLPEDAFYGAENLEKVMLPYSLREVNQDAFASTKIDTLYFMQDDLTLHKYAFQSANVLNRITFVNDTLSVEKYALQNAAQDMHLVFNCGYVSLEQSSITIKPDNVLYFLKGEISFEDNCFNYSGFNDSASAAIKIGPNVTQISGVLNVPPYRGTVYVFGEEGSAAQDLFTRSRDALSTSFAQRLVFVPTENGKVKEWESEAEGFKYVVDSGEVFITGCTQDASVISIPSYLGDAVGYYPVTGIRSGAFKDCTRLTKLILPSTIREVPSDLAGKVSSANAGFTALEVHPDNPYFSAQDGVLYNREMSVLLFPMPGVRELTIPETVTQIGEYAFCCSRVTALTVPDQVTIFGENALGGSLEIV